MRIALAVWNERISPVFDVARQILLLDIQEGKILTRREATLPGVNPWQQAARLEELNPEILICGAISEPLAGLLAAKSIRVVPFIAGAVNEVIDAYLAGSLPNRALAMPGCCGRGRRWMRGGRGRNAFFGPTRTARY